MPDLGKAELALHDRMTMACAAASDAGLPGQFCAWRQDGLLAVSATAPELAFLSAVSGINPSTVSSAIQLIATSDWGDDGPTMISSPEPDGAHAVAQSMRAAGLARAPDRVVAIRHLSDDNPPAGPAPFEDVLADSPAATFVPVLLGGYRVDGAVAAFIAAEHRLAAVRRYLLISAGVAVAAAAMSIHGDVAVLGGAATLPGHRGQGAQTRLLQHRLWAAREAGCRLATATAAPNSASARNLARAGFTLVHRPAWHRPVSHPSPTPPAGQAPPPPSTA